MVLIRKARLSDEKILIQLINELTEYIYDSMKNKASSEVITFNAPDKTEIKERFKKLKSYMASKDFFIYLALIKKAPVGYIICEEMPAEFYKVRITGEIVDLYVRKEYRGRGISSLLLKKAFNEFKKRRINYVMLDVSVYNKQAINVYHKWGFRDYTRQLLLKE